MRICEYANMLCLRFPDWRGREVQLEAVAQVTAVLRAWADGSIISAGPPKLGQKWADKF